MQKKGCTMKNPDTSAQTTPTVQVIGRMFTLLEILAGREEAVSLKEISEKSGLHQEATGSACACWS
jgi:hypothetical protein